MTHQHPDATLVPGPGVDLALFCPTCEARDLRRELERIADDLRASGLLVDAQTAAASVQRTVDQLDYVLSLVDANALAQGIDP